MGEKPCGNFSIEFLDYNATFNHNESPRVPDMFVNTFVRVDTVRAQQTRHVLLVSGRMRLVLPCLVLKIPLWQISIITVHCAKTHLTDHPVRLYVTINIFPMYPKRYVRLESGMRSDVRFLRPQVAVLASLLEWLGVLVFCCCFFVACFCSFLRKRHKPTAVPDTLGTVE